MAKRRAKGQKEPSNKSHIPRRLALMMTGYVFLYGAMIGWLFRDIFLRKAKAAEHIQTISRGRRSANFMQAILIQSGSRSQ